MAGGMTEDACHDYVNLAEKLVDGEKIYIPTAEEVEALHAEAQAAVDAAIQYGLDSPYPDPSVLMEGIYA